MFILQQAVAPVGGPRFPSQADFNAGAPPAPPIGAPGGAPQGGDIFGVQPIPPPGGADHYQQFLQLLRSILRLSNQEGVPINIATGQRHTDPATGQPLPSVEELLQRPEFIQYAGLPEVQQIRAAKATQFTQLNDRIQGALRRLLSADNAAQFQAQVQAAINGTIQPPLSEQETASVQRMNQKGMSVEDIAKLVVANRTVLQEVNGFVAEQGQNNLIGRHDLERLRQNSLATLGELGVNTGGPNGPALSFQDQTRLSEDEKADAAFVGRTVQVLSLGHIPFGASKASLYGRVVNWISQSRVGRWVAGAFQAGGRLHWLTRAGTWLSGCRVLRPLMALGRGAGWVGGRVLPIAGALFAVADCGGDCIRAYSVCSTGRNPDGTVATEGDKNQAVGNAVVNVTCTAVGGVIGACLGGPVGAMIGMGIGNLVAYGINNIPGVNLISRGIGYACRNWIVPVAEDIYNHVLAPIRRGVANFAKKLLPWNW